MHFILIVSFKFRRLKYFWYFVDQNETKIKTVL